MPRVTRQAPRAEVDLIETILFRIRRVRMGAPVPQSDAIASVEDRVFPGARRGETHQPGLWPVWQQVAETANMPFQWDGLDGAKSFEKMLDHTICMLCAFSSSLSQSSSVRMIQSGRLLL